MIFSLVSATIQLSLLVSLQILFARCAATSEGYDLNNLSLASDIFDSSDSSLALSSRFSLCSLSLSTLNLSTAHLHSLSNSSLVLGGLQWLICHSQARSKRSSSDISSQPPPYFQ